MCVWEDSINCYYFSSTCLVLNMLFGFEHKDGKSRTMSLCLFESEINKSCLPPPICVLVEKVPMLGYKQAEYCVWSICVNR
jgi:hypothetical protein